MLNDKIIDKMMNWKGFRRKQSWCNPYTVAQFAWQE
jgi:hypothetical protein